MNPTSKVKAKSLITEPPKMRSARTAKSVVPTVKIVRESEAFSPAFKTTL